MEIRKIGKYLNKWDINKEFSEISVQYEKSFVMMICTYISDSHANRAHIY